MNNQPLSLLSAATTAHTQRPTWRAPCVCSIRQRPCPRFPCTGKIEENYLLAAFEQGVDGVIVAGCLEGGCHFLEGNLRARKRVGRAKQFLSEAGVEQERLEMFQSLLGRGAAFRGDRAGNERSHRPARSESAA